MLIAHATEHIDQTDRGLLHAVAVAAAHSGGAEIVTLHVTLDDSEPASAPHAAALLERWMLSPRPDVRHRIHRCAGHDDDIADELIAACERLQPDLLILPTHARKGLLGLLVGSIAEAVVILYEDDERRAVVAAVDPTATMASTGNPKLAEVAESVKQKLTNALAKLE
jgi:nucleotide-binding universal stress UspA family protein